MQQIGHLLSLSIACVRKTCIWSVVKMSSKEEYKPWKWGATARYYTSHTKTILPTGKSVPEDPPGNWTTQRPPDDRKETQTAEVWSCFLFIRSGQNHLARHSERGKKTRHSEEEVGRQRQGMYRPGVRQVPEGSGEQWKMEETGCKIICGASTIPVVKRMMMMMTTKMGTTWGRPVLGVLWRWGLREADLRLECCEDGDYVRQTCVWSVVKMGTTWGRPVFAVLWRGGLREEDLCLECCEDGACMRKTCVWSVVKMGTTWGRPVFAVLWRWDYMRKTCVWSVVKMRTTWGRPVFGVLWRGGLREEDLCLECCEEGDHSSGSNGSTKFLHIELDRK